MLQIIEVTEVRIRLAEGAGDDLVGWASCIVNGSLFLNNIKILRHEDGEIHLSYPAVKSRSGSKHFVFNPINRETKRALDEAILGKLKMQVGRRQSCPVRKPDNGRMPSGCGSSRRASPRLEGP